MADRSSELTQDRLNLFMYINFEWEIQSKKVNTTVSVSNRDISNTDHEQEPIRKTSSDEIREEAVVAH